MYTVGLYTLGCKVSQYETEAIGEKFERLGFSICPFEEKNDVYVINTCTVTAESDAKCRKFIRRAVKKNPDALVMVTGCYSQRDADAVMNIAGVSVVIGTENKLSLPDMAKEMLAKRESTGGFEKYKSVTDVACAEFEAMSISRAPRTRAYVKIEDGCESKCTYCAISYARGRVRSKKPEDAIAEVETLYAGGTREIVLTGIETGSYGRDFDGDYDLASLICELAERKSCERIRLGSLAPELIGESFVNRVKGVDILAPHFHLSIQSGSDAVLRGMKRRYNSHMAMNTIENIKKNIPRATFTTDLMVGFPGESEENFLETVDFVRRAGFLDAHVFMYSKRAGTEAAEYDRQIPEPIKKERSERLMRVVAEVRDSVLDKIISSEEHLSAIVETRTDSYYTAHSDTYVEARFSSEREDLQGEMVLLRPLSHKDGVVYCELVNQ